MKAELKAERQNLLASFEEKLSLLQAFQEKLENFQGYLIPTSQKAFDIALKNYRFGKIDFATLTGSADAFINSKIERETLLTDELALEAEIEELLGGEATL